MSEVDEAWLISDRLLEVATRDPARELLFDPLFGRFSYADIARQSERVASGISVISSTGVPTH